MNAKQTEIVKTKGAKGLGGLWFAASTGPNQNEIQALTNLSGSLAASYHYDSFGNLAAVTGGLGEVLTAGQLLSGAWQPHSLSHVVSSNPFTYTGRELDAESGLYYYRARYYDPQAGRFLQEDPIFAENLYGYVGNDPQNSIDPHGKNKLTINPETGIKYDCPDQYAQPPDYCNTSEKRHEWYEKHCKPIGAVQNKVLNNPNDPNGCRAWVEKTFCQNGCTSLQLLALISQHCSPNSSPTKGPFPYEPPPRRHYFNTKYGPMSLCIPATPAKPTKK